ncbi:MAG: hypothetical protein U9P90_02215 [Patescibacteria group bacterium]|nr:hypothetical protein [Patescibacteria group bacterium]
MNRITFELSEKTKKEFEIRVVKNNTKMTVVLRNFVIDYLKRKTI